MLAEYHASPHARVLSLPLETYSTKFETSHFSVRQENLQNNKHEFKNLQTILEHIENIMYSENRKGMLSDIKTEFEHTVQSTDIHVLQDYLHSLYNYDSEFWYDDEGLTCLFYLIVHHVLVASENENSTQILNVIKDNLQQCDVYFYLDRTFQLYLDVYYKDNPNDIFTNIHSIWKCDKATELNLKLVYCKNLIVSKDYKTLIQLIHHHADNLIESFEKIEHKQSNSSTAIMVLLHVLHYQVSLNKMERVKTITTILSRLSMSISWYDEHDLLNGFSDFLPTLDNKQLLCTPYVIKLLQSLMKEQPLNYLNMLLLFSERLRQANHYTECIDFIKSNFQFISSFPTKKLKIQEECYYRQQYCITLLLLLNEYVTCYDTHKINLMLTKLLDFRVSFLSDIQSTLCYCFMGNKQCMAVGNNSQYLTSMMHEPQKQSRSMLDFKQHLLDIWDRTHGIIQDVLLPIYPRERIPCDYDLMMNMDPRERIPRDYDLMMNMDPRERIPCDYDLMMNTDPIERIPHDYDLMMNMNPREQIPHDYDLMMNNVIQGEMEQVSYLKSIIEMMEINKYKVESVLSFIEFIERSTDYNVESLYNIINMLCAFELQPEIEDMILQGLTAFFMISCNKQYGLLSKFILDINMICPKGQFLHKLTSGIAKSLLKLDDDTVKDFNNLIYKCYCTVRHDCRDEKDKNITKYKDHFNFIASLEAEEEMKKLTSLTNLLLLLTILFMASGGHHKSAELKKYLSLKYEYRDSILYLLWCSGDVEINPGPTLSTLRKVPDSVKERIWIYEMCSVLLRLLKYKSIDIRIDGLWKEKPLDWPVDSLFYDPRNKPKGKGYSIKTDRELLKNLEEFCNGKGVLEEVTQFDDEYTKSTVKQYQTEITAWRTNKADLFELYILRQELDILLKAKISLQKYKKEPELKDGLSVLNVDLIFDSEEEMCVSNAGYTDIVRDIAITFCRIGKGLDPLEKSDGIWKTPPTGWCPTYEYFSPCNAGKRQGKCKDKELVDHLIRCCETKVQEYCKVHKKPVLIKMLHAWKHENKQEVWKYHTVWANMEVIDHSLKYLKLEGLLAKSQTHLEKLGIKPRKFKESIHDSNDLPLCPVQDKQNYPKCQTIIQSDQENNFDHPVKLRDSDASQKVVPFTLKGIEYQETDQTTQNNTNKRKLQSTDENYTDPKKLHKSDKGISLPIHTSPTEQCQGEPINDLTPITVLNDILDLQDESNLNQNSSLFNIPPFIRSLMTISNEDTTHAVQQETPIETIVEYLKR